MLFAVVRRFERDEDAIADCYLFVCAQLSAKGFRRVLRFDPGGRARSPPGCARSPATCASTGTGAWGRKPEACGRTPAAVGRTPDDRCAASGDRGREPEAGWRLARTASPRAVPAPLFVTQIAVSDRRRTRIVRKCRGSAWFHTCSATCPEPTACTAPGLQSRRDGRSSGQGYNRRRR